MGHIFNLLLHEPLLNALVFLYQTVAFESFGLAIILLTVIIRIILFPIFQKSVRHQSAIQKIQPELKKIQELHKEDKAKQAEAMMALYKNNNINPFSGILLLLVQLPVLIALLQIFRGQLTPESLSGLYDFISAPQNLNTNFLGLINLKESSIVGGNIAVLILAAGAQYLQSKLSLSKVKKGQQLSKTEKLGRNMAYVGPVLTLVFLSALPAAVGLYWLTTSVFSIFQQIIVNRELEEKKDDRKLGNIRKNSNNPNGV